MAGERCYMDLSWATERSVPREREVELDLESGGTTSEEDRINHVGDRGFFSRGWDELYGWVNSGSDENLGLLVDKNSEGEDQLQHMVGVEEKPKKKKSRKPPKPPRPPKGPPLDAADQKLMQEITELAIRKRARAERIKALKKMRAGKASSWSSSLYAMVITVLFCLVIIFQGIYSRNHGNMFLQGSPEPAVAASEDLIYVQFHKNFSAYEGDGSGSRFPSLAEGQATDSGLGKN